MRGTPRLSRPALAALLLLRSTPALPQAGQVAKAPGQPAQLVFGSEVEVVRLDALVLDAAGRPVAGLTPADFEIEENERTQTISSFEPVVVPPTPPSTVSEPPRLSTARVRAPSEGRCLMLYFDDVHVSQPAIDKVRQSLRQFLATELREGDLVTLVAPEQEIWWTARNGWEYRQLAAVVERLKGQGGGDSYADWEAIRALESGLPGVTGQRAVMAGGGAPPAGPASGSGAGARGRSDRPSDEVVGGVGRSDASFLAEETLALVKRRTGMTLARLRSAVESLLPLRGHKSLLLVSEGFLLVPGMPGYQELVDAARRANVAIHYLDPRELTTGLASAAVPSGQGRPEPGALPGTMLSLATGEAEGIAVATGGHPFGGVDAGTALRRVVSEADAYYLLGYTPDSTARGERRVRVRVKRPGLKVLARSRYFVGTAEAAPVSAPAAVPAAAASPAALAAMRSVADATELPLRVSTLFFEPTGRAEVSTLLAVEVADPNAEAGDHAFELVSEARPRDGGPAVRDRFELSPAPRGEAPIVLARQWQLPPGVWQVRVLLREVAGGRVGTAVHTFEVPPPSGFRISTPIVTSELEDGQRKPRLSLDRTFRSGGVVYCQYSVYGAGLGSVLGSWALLRDGVVVREAPPTPVLPSADGRRTRTLGVSLQDAAPGAYTLVLSVRDESTGRDLSRAEPFTVAP